MEPAKPLPYSSIYADSDAYVDDLLQFVTGSDLFQTLCGGIHVLDFLTRDPDLYAQVLPEEWRQWLSETPIMDFLDFLMREDIDDLAMQASRDHPKQWRGRPLPPQSLLAYVKSIRQLSLDRSFVPSENVIPGSLGRRLSAGMKRKKAHEVENFAAFVDSLIDNIEVASGASIDSVVDFGSGQNYLGRVLASPLYQRGVIAVESKHWNISNAQILDVNAHMAEKITVWRNKKTWRLHGVKDAEDLRRELEKAAEASAPQKPKEDSSPQLRAAKIRYVEHSISNGDLSGVLGQLRLDANGNAHGTITETDPGDADPVSENLMVVSLHSCGNLLHHGLRSLVMNPSVSAVAMVGCCYNLVTECLGPPTLKLPSLRIFSKRLIETSSACDPHGFPMSERLAGYTHTGGKGVRMNITARMMACQAPQNWTEVESDGFFTRNFFRALLQRIMLDRGFVQAPIIPDGETDIKKAAAPITIGSLPKPCFISFTAYVRGALKKIAQDPEYAQRLEECMGSMTDEDILEYEQRYRPRRHHLSIIWSLMAFSACVVESLMVTDRWLYLREQPEVSKAWVQSCFDYQLSPRNLVVVGIKK